MYGSVRRRSAIRGFRIALFPVLGLVMPARAGDLGDVKQRGTLRHLGIPYASFVTGTGDGPDVELMQGFARELGVKYEYVKEDWGNIFGDLTGRKVKPNGADIEFVADTPIKGDVAANGITVLPWREKAAVSSSPTFPNQVWLVARADSPTLPITSTKDTATDIEAVKKLIAGHSLIGKAGTCLDPSLYKLEAITNRIKLFAGSLNEIAPALLNGEAELTLLDVPDALVALQKWPGQIKIIGPVSGKQQMAVAFAKDSPELLAAFNGYLERCRKDGTYVALVKKYYPFVTPAQYMSDNLQFLKDVFASLFAYMDEVQAVCRNGLSPEHARQLASAAESLDLEFARSNAPRALEETSQGIARITEIVSAMKEFSRPGSREKEPVDLNKALASTITMTQSEWKGACAVKTELAGDLPAIVCRACEMNQVFLNLIVNAAQAIADAVGDSGVKGVISISTRRDADIVEVRIRDTGNGIPADVRDRVFDPFFTTKEVGRETGQGLSVARSIVVDKHGGELSFQTEPGKGTTFLVRLPIG